MNKSLLYACLQEYNILLMSPWDNLTLCQRRYDRKRVTDHTHQFAPQGVQIMEAKPFAFKLSAEVFEDFARFYEHMWYFPRRESDPLRFCSAAKG